MQPDVARRKAGALLALWTTLGMLTELPPAALLAAPAMLLLGDRLQTKRRARENLERGVVRRRTVFHRLPEEVFAYTCTMLGLRELTSLALVSTAVRVASDSPDVWRLLVRRYGLAPPAATLSRAPPPAAASWKQFFFERRVMLPVLLAREHASRDDCYVVVDGAVYDVTGFLSSHPGGERVILDVAGLDATDVWRRFDHSSAARAMMEEFRVPLPAPDSGGQVLARALKKRDQEVAKARRMRQAELVVGELRSLWGRLTSGT